MNLRVLIIGALSAIILFVSVAALNRTSDSMDFLQNRAMITVRAIGHKLLLSTGDSSSHILPVKQLANGIFQLEFQNRFSFVPDTLVSIVHSNLAALEVPVNYLVNVFDCHSNEIVYGFQINPKRNDIIPCLGRAQPTGCYLIQITFVDLAVSETRSTDYFFYFTAFLGITLVVLGGQTYFQRKGKPARVERDGAMEVGKYSFIVERRLLRAGSETIELSEKETKLLKIFAGMPNQLITRDQLLKEVWEDDGVFTGRSLDVFISKLRKKLKDDPTIELVNIHGIGYKLQVGSTGHP